MLLCQQGCLIPPALAPAWNTPKKNQSKRVKQLQQRVLQAQLEDCRISSLNGSAFLRKKRKSIFSRSCSCKDKLENMRTTLGEISEATETGYDYSCLAQLFSSFSFYTSPIPPLIASILEAELCSTRKTINALIYFSQDPMNHS